MLNPNKEYTIKIIEAIFKNDGYCPCVLEKTQDTICPCKNFLENNKCKCKLFL